MTPEPNAAASMNRRQFLFVTAAALVTGCQSIHGAGDGATLASHERLINAGPVSNYAADGLYEGFRDFGFFFVRKGNELTVYSSYCTHRKCKLSSEPDHSFSCPCHGSTFAPDGKVTRGPANRDLSKLPAYTDEKGQLLVTVPAL